VQENLSATPRQAMGNSLNPKNNRKSKPSCGAVKNTTPTQKEKLSHYIAT